MVQRNSFRFFLLITSVAGDSKAGECCIRRAVWTVGDSRWEAAQLQASQGGSSSLLSASPAYAKWRRMLAKTASADWAGRNCEVCLACGLHEVLKC